MNPVSPEPNPAPTPRIWPVGALCLAVAQALDVRFNPVAVCGEISGFSRAASGHCYFTLKDATGQLRCAMFRRVADTLGFVPANGDQVELRGRLGVYEARGDLQLVVEGLRRAGQGTLFEQFVRLKARLEAQGLFDPARKRPLPAHPRGIGIVTSLGAAALHDVLTALARRVPHIPVVVAPAAVQGAQAPAELLAALQALQSLPHSAPAPAAVPIDVILLVRGGGSIEDLWAFNDEALVHAIAACPLPVISGVGHETDFTIADFVADLRAPTPTAAAELAAAPRQALLDQLARHASTLSQATQRQIERHGQRLDAATHRLARPQALLARQRLRLAQVQQRLRHAMLSKIEQENTRLRAAAAQFTPTFQAALARHRQRTHQAATRLHLLDPQRVLDRGYALLTNPSTGHVIRSTRQTQPHQHLSARLAQGTLHLTVQPHPDSAAESQFMPSEG